MPRHLHFCFLPRSDCSVSIPGSRVPSATKLRRCMEKIAILHIGSGDCLTSENACKSHAVKFSPPGQLWGLGRNALGLSHLTYEMVRRIFLHLLDLPPFPCAVNLFWPEQRVKQYFWMIHAVFLCGSYSVHLRVEDDSIRNGMGIERPRQSHKQILILQKILVPALRGGGVAIGLVPTVALRSTVGYSRLLPPVARQAVSVSAGKRINFGNNKHSCDCPDCLPSHSGSYFSQLIEPRSTSYAAILRPGRCGRGC
jgi:hypothetical protein